MLNGRVTHKWIPYVRFSGRARGFDPSLQVRYILTGHGSLNSFLFSRNLAGSPDCMCGYEREDWVHVLFNCKMYESFRNLQDLKVKFLNNAWDVSGVLKDRVAYKCLCMFVERAFRMRASLIARVAANRDNEHDIVEEYEKMVAALNVDYLVCIYLSNEP